MNKVGVGELEDLEFLIVMEYLRQQCHLYQTQQEYQFLLQLIQ